MFSKDFDSVAHVRARLAERPYSKHAPTFALIIAGHLRPVGRDLQTRGVRMRDLAAEAGVSLKTAQRLANELCSGPAPVYEKAITTEPNLGTRGYGFTTVAIRSFRLIPPAF